MYGFNDDNDGQIIVTSSCVATAVLISKSNVFNRILYDSNINPEMIEAFSSNANAHEFKSFS
jgi:hypothetical protein